jgi:hypothetical protein
MNYTEENSSSSNKPKKVKKHQSVEDKVNSWFCPINPMVQVAEYFYNMRKKNG